MIIKRNREDELWETEEEMVNYYQKEENYQKLLRGDAGGNLIYKYKSKNLATAMPEWIEYLSKLLNDLVIKNNKENLHSTKEKITAQQHEILMLTEYHKNRTWKFLDGLSTENEIVMESDYDFLNWTKESEALPLKKYRVKKPINYYFSYSKTQLRERNDMFRRYGTSVSALSKIVTRIEVVNWLRGVSTNPSNKKDNINNKRSRTRYAMST